MPADPAEQWYPKFVCFLFVSLVKFFLCRTAMLVVSRLIMDAMPAVCVRHVITRYAVTTMEKDRNGSGRWLLESYSVLNVKTRRSISLHSNKILLSNSFNR